MAVNVELYRKLQQKVAEATAEADAPPANKKKQAPKSKKIVNMDSAGGFLADHLATQSWGGERAGRAKAMAEASGQRASMRVRHPFTSRVLTNLAGGGLGAAGGAGLGALAAMLYPSSSSQTLSDWAGGGAVLGGAGGALAGQVYDGIKRRQDMTEIGKNYDTAAAAGKLKPNRPDFSALAAVLAPMRGPHRTGQLEAYRTVAGGPSIAEQRGARDGFYAADHVVPHFAIGHLYGQNLRTQFANADRDTVYE
jgi:hypothetical protein